MEIDPTIDAGDLTCPREVLPRNHNAVQLSTRSTFCAIELDIS